MRFYNVLYRFICVYKACTWFCMVLYGVIKLYKVLYGFLFNGFTLFHKVLWFYMVLCGFVKLYLVLYGFRRFYKVS